MAPYRSASVDAGRELHALGLEAARWFLLKLQAITSRRRPYRNDAWFTRYGAVPVYKLDRNGLFVVYVVEEEPDESIVVTLLCADRVARFAVGQVFEDSWDKAALAELEAYVRPRLEDFFHDDGI